MAPHLRQPHRVLDVPANAAAAAIEAAYGRARRLLDQDAMASYGMFDAASAARLRDELDGAYEALMAKASDAPAQTTNQPPAVAGSFASAALAPAAEAPAAAPLPAAAATLPQLPAAVASPRASARRSIRARLCAPRSEPLEEPCTGALLRRLREEAEADIDAVCDLTKINRRYIKALEEEDFALLPASVYVRGFVGEYARVLGIDGSVATSTYMRAFTTWARAHL